MNENCKYCGQLTKLNAPTKHYDTGRTRMQVGLRKASNKELLINPEKKYYQYTYDEKIYKDGIGNYHARCQKCCKMVFYVPEKIEKTYPIDPIYHLEEKLDNGTISIRPSTMFFEFGYHWPGNYGKNWPFASVSDYEDIRNSGQLNLLF